MTAFDEPVVAWRGATEPDAPLVVLSHGRGSNEADIVAAIRDAGYTPRRRNMTYSVRNEPLTA